MDKEPINGVPEEDEVAAEQQEITVGESTEESAESPETQAEPVPEDEPAAEESESTEDSSETEESPEPEETDESELCTVCGESRKAEGSDYCPECEAAMLKRKIPFIGWIAGIAVIIVGAFAFISAALNCAPALQSAKGDYYARQKCWYTAFNEYSQVSSVVDEITSSFGSPTPFVQAGTGIKAKIIECAAECTSPLEAYSVASSYFSLEEMEKIRPLKKYADFINEFQASYEALSDPINDMLDGKTNAEETLKAFEAVKGQENIKDIFIDYYKFNAAAYLNEDLETQIELLEAVRKDDETEKKDYSWLYSADYSSALFNAGRLDEAAEILDGVIDNNKTLLSAYEMRMAIAFAQNDSAKADSLLSEFMDYNEDYDTAFTLETVYFRIKGELEKAESVCLEGLEKYDSVPELHRQLALIYLLKGDYDNAYEQAYSADQNAYMLYYYYGDSSAYNDPALINTLYLCAYLNKTKGQLASENAGFVDEIIESFTAEELSDEVNAIVNGEKTVEEILSEGAYDLA